MPKWNKMDHKVWENSEVMKEYEKLLLKHLKKASESIDEALLKEAQVASNVTQKLDGVSKSTETAAKNMNTLLNMSKSLADDQEEPGPTEEEMAKEALLGELYELASKASILGDHKEAYSIERTIDIILYGDK